MNFYIYQDKHGQWRWRLKADNGRILADSGEAYTRRRDVLRALVVVAGAFYAHSVDCELEREGKEWRIINP